MQCTAAPCLKQWPPLTAVPDNPVAILFAFEATQFPVNKAKYHLGAKLMHGLLLLRWMAP